MELITGFFHILKLGLQHLGFASTSAALILIGIIAGSFFIIPLGKKKLILVEQSRLFGLLKKSGMAAQGISINVGGAIVPVLVSLYLLLKLPLKETLIAILFMIVVARVFSRYVPGKGVLISPVMPALFAMMFAFSFAREFMAQVSFVSGVFGVLVGADLLRIPFMQKDSLRSSMCIGGAGVFDGIVLIALSSALIAGF